MSEETDGQLVERTRQGDLSAFEAIVTRHRAGLIALAASRLASYEDAEDVAQEAFVLGFFRLYQLRRADALLPWLRRLTERLALARLRNRREEPLEPEQLARLTQITERAARRADTLSLLEGLPKAMRETAELVYLHGHTCAEAAALLGVREGTVKSRLNRTRARLREEVEMARSDSSREQTAQQFTSQTIERLMREARRLLAKGDLDAAGQRAEEVLGIQAKQLFASGDAPGFRFNEDAARIAGLPFKERRRREAEVNAAQYGFKLEELDWQVADLDMLQGTLGKPTGHGKDWWGIPCSRMKLKIIDARDICRRLQCSPIALFDWVQQGCPVLRCWPFARYDLDRVKQWLRDNDINDWPRESDHDTDRPLRIIFRALHRQEVTPEKAEEVITELGWGDWG